MTIDKTGILVSI